MKSMKLALLSITFFVFAVKADEAVTVQPDVVETNLVENTTPNDKQETSTTDSSDTKEETVAVNN